MKCSECGVKIPKERLEALPDTKVCVNCSNLEPLVGITVWDDCTPELIILKEKDAKKLHSGEISIERL